MESNPYHSPSSNLFGSSNQTTPEAVPAEAIVQLQRTKPWTRFVGVVIWLATALMMLGGCAMLFMAMMGIGSAETGIAEKGMLAGMAAAYLVVGLIYIYPAVKIWSYGSAIASLMKSRSPEDLVKALDQQRALWKFAGIITIILMVLYGMIIVGAILFGVAGAMKGLPQTP